MVTIYVLRLENNKYYVGKTTNKTKRIQDHFDGNGSEWTRKYQPISVLKTIEDCDDFDEDKWTKKMMAKYGIDNVRGGTYCELKLSSDIKQKLVQEISGAEDKCFKCNSDSHFVKDCTKKESTGFFFKFIDSIMKAMDDKDDDEDDDECFRCGRIGHWASECYAKTDIDGVKLRRKRYS